MTKQLMAVKSQTVMIHVATTLGRIKKCCHPAVYKAKNGENLDAAGVVAMTTSLPLMVIASS